MDYISELRAMLEGKPKKEDNVATARRYCFSNITPIYDLVDNISVFPYMSLTETEQNEVIVEIIALIEEQLKSGADIDATNNGDTALMYASWLIVNYDVVECLLRNGANANFIDEEGNSILDICTGEHSWLVTCGDDKKASEMDRIIYLLKQHGAKHSPGYIERAKEFGFNLE